MAALLWYLHHGQAYLGFRKETLAFTALTAGSIVGHELGRSIRLIDSMLTEISIDRLDALPIGTGMWLSGRLEPCGDRHCGVNNTDGQSVGREFPRGSHRTVIVSDANISNISAPIQ